MRITKLQHSGLWLLGLVVFIGGFAAQARAQERIGVRAGVSGDPNQFYLGVHVETRPVADRLRFRPNIEIGLGDNETLVALNLEFVYPIPLPNSPWRVYFGAGPALDIHGARGPRDSATGGGFNILLGLAHTGGLFTELKVGALESPNLKFGIGYTF